jgi:hypothetical protein
MGVILDSLESQLSGLSAIDNSRAGATAAHCRSSEAEASFYHIAFR